MGPPAFLGGGASPWTLPALAGQHHLGGRHQIGMVGGIRSESWAARSRMALRREVRYSELYGES